MACIDGNRSQMDKPKTHYKCYYIEKSFREIRVAVKKDSSSFPSSVHEVHFAQAPNFSEIKGSIISPQNFCLKGYILGVHHQLLVHQKRNAVSPKHNREGVALHQ